jgi:hypothetical protein
MESVDLLTIKDLGGWKTLTMVQRYAHLSKEHRQSAIERLATRSAAQRRTLRPVRSSTVISTRAIERNWECAGSD